MTSPQSELAVSAEESSASDRMMRVRSVWSSARHASDWPSTARRNEIDCVATMGIQPRLPRQCERLLVAGGDPPPSVRKLWYTSHRNTAGLHSRDGRRAISAGRRSRVWSHACYSITPTARESTELVPAGMFRQYQLILSRIADEHPPAFRDSVASFLLHRPPHHRELASPNRHHSA